MVKNAIIALEKIVHCPLHTVRGMRTTASQNQVAPLSPPPIARWTQPQASTNKTLSLSGQGEGRGDQHGLRYSAGLRQFEQSAPEVGHRWRN